jgi:nitrogen fixation-related uncharacterized protein
LPFGLRRAAQRKLAGELKNRQAYALPLTWKEGGTIMNPAYIVLIIASGLMGVVAVGFLAWAFRAGQMENFQRGATSIFDPDEPLGEVTDNLLAPKENRPSPDAEQPHG